MIQLTKSRCRDVEGKSKRCYRVQVFHDYDVTRKADGSWSCTCPEQSGKCEHIKAVVKNYHHDNFKYLRSQ